MAGFVHAAAEAPVEAPVRPPAPTPTESGPGPRNEGEEICHLVEAEDPDTALCGKDVTGWPWNPPWPYCVVCVDIAQSRPHWGDALRQIGFRR